MKKYLVIAVAALSLAACSKSAVSNVQATQDEDRVPVLFGATRTISVATKGQGAVDAWDGNQVLHIFGHDKDENFTTGYLIDNAVAASPVNPGADSSIVVKKANGELYYYEGKKVYSFHAFYADDATLGDVEYLNDSLQVAVTIDGTQDILYGYTKPEKDTVGTNAKLPLDQVYSAKSARRNVIPNLVFKHAGSRFVFDIIDKTAQTGAALTIDSLAIVAQTKANLVFADTTVTHLGFLDTPSNSVPDSLWLKKADLSGTQTGDTISGDIENLGAGIITLPNAAEYKGILILSQDGTSTKYKNPFTLSFSDRAGGKAMPGKQYRVNITVYGLSQVDITVSLEKWDEDKTPFVVDEDA